MDRRAAIKKFLIFSAGAALIPSCLQEEGKSSIPLNNIKISSDQEMLLAEISESIIPATDTPGAKDVSAHAFVLIMVDDCYHKDEQDKFLKGLDDFENFCKKEYDNSFIKCNPSQREEILKELDGKKEKPQSELSYFYSSMKRLTLQGYMTSKYYLTTEQVYELVPGPYHGCISITEVNKKNV